MGTIDAAANLLTPNRVKVSDIVKKLNAEEDDGWKYEVGKVEDRRNNRVLYNVRVYDDCGAFMGTL